MSVDVVYRGLAIARGAPVRVEGTSLFIETDTPMPVQTRLTIVHEDHRMEGRVLRVNEGAGAGMLCVPVDGASLPSWVGRIRQRVVQTVEVEAEPEPEVAQEKASPRVEEQVPAAPEPKAVAETVHDVSTGPIRAPSVIVAEEGMAAEQGRGYAAVQEATQEMPIPADEDVKLENEPAPRENGSEKRSNKKKKSSRRR